MHVYTWKVEGFRTCKLLETLSRAMASPLLALASRKRFQKSCTPGGPMQWANPSTPAVAPKVISNQPLDKKKHAYPITWISKNIQNPNFGMFLMILSKIAWGPNYRYEYLTLCEMIGTDICESIVFHD